jgi:hypothetical protein
MPPRKPHLKKISIMVFHSRWMSDFTSLQRELEDIGVDLSVERHVRCKATTSYIWMCLKMPSPLES